MSIPSRVLESVTSQRLQKFINTNIYQMIIKLFMGWKFAATEVEIKLPI